jgi:hypothetical protein
MKSNITIFILSASGSKTLLQVQGLYKKIPRRAAEAFSKDECHQYKISE